MKDLKFKKIGLFSVLTAVVLIMSTANISFADCSREYDCSYQEGNTYHYSTVPVDENGRICTSKCYSPDSRIIEMYNSGKCKPIIARHYVCKYPAGTCDVKLYKTGGHAAFGTNATTTAVDDAKAGKCQFVGEY